MAAADGPVAVGAAPLPRPSARAGARSERHVLDLRGLQSRPGPVRAALSRARDLCREFQLHLLWRNGAALRDLDVATAGSTLVRRDYSHHLPLRRRGVPLHLRDVPPEAGRMSELTVGRR